MRYQAIMIAAALAALTFAGRAAAQIHAIEPEQAGADFPLQGEYLGEAVVGGTRTVLAAQVAAMGGGVFRAVMLPGGFPGAGYKGTGRVEAPGTRSGAKGSATGGGYQLAFDGTDLTGSGPGGVTVTLHRTVRSSPTMGLAAPSGATILFGGKDLSAWDSTAGIDARGFLKVPSQTKPISGNFSVHLEFRVPFEPEGRGQARGNSGFVMPTGTWSELQVLDSFGDEPLIDGLGSVYANAKPLVVASLPPLAWQTYDIQYTAPVTSGTTAPAKFTAWINGVLVQEGTVLKNRPTASVILLQDHTHPVFYRNIWMVPGKSDYDFMSGVSIAVPRKNQNAGLHGSGFALKGGVPLFRSGSAGVFVSPLGRIMRE